MPVPPPQDQFGSPVPRQCNPQAPLTIQALTAVLNNATAQQLTAFAGPLVCTGDPTSPLATAIEEASPECQTQLGSANELTIARAITGELPAVLEVLTAILHPEGDVLVLTEQIAGWVISNLLPFIVQQTSVSVICDPTQPPGFSVQIVGEKPFLRLVLNLSPTIDCTGGGGVETADVILQYETCDPTQPPAQVVAPSLVSVSGTNSAQLFQIILDKLSNLERCCNPCDETDFQVLTGISGIGQQLFPTSGVYTQFDAIEVDITAARAQIATIFSNPPRWKYGTFTFLYTDGTFSAPQFVNYSGQKFFVPRSEYPCVGIGWHLAPGVIANVIGFAQANWLGGVQYK